MGWFRRNSKATRKRRALPGTSYVPLDDQALGRFADTHNGFPRVQTRELVALLPVAQPVPEGTIAELWTVTSHPPRDFATVIARPDGTVGYVWFGTLPGPDGSSTLDFFHADPLPSTHRFAGIEDVHAWAALMEDLVPKLYEFISAEAAGRIDPGQATGGLTVASGHAPFQRFAERTQAPVLMAWRRLPQLDFEVPDGTGRIELWGEVSAHGPIGYLHLAVAFDRSGDITGIAAAEVAPDLHDDCYLGLFTAGGRTNLGKQPEIRDPHRFADAAQALLIPTLTDHR